MRTSGMKKRGASATTGAVICGLILLECSPGAPPVRFSVAVIPGSADTVPQPVTPLQRRPTVATGERVGAFELLVERDTSTIHLQHVPSRWTRVHLSFTTPGDGANVTLTDNGASLVVSTRTWTSCSISTFYYQYRQRADGSHLYGAMADALNASVEACPRGVEAAPSLFTRAEADFPAAMQAMMAKVDEVFHGRRLVRCENPADFDDRHAWGVLADQCQF